MRTLFRATILRTHQLSPQLFFGIDPPPTQSPCTQSVVTHAWVTEREVVAAAGGGGLCLLTDGAVTTTWPTGAPVTALRRLATVCVRPWVWFQSHGPASLATVRLPGPRLAVRMARPQGLDGRHR